MVGTWCVGTYNVPILVSIYIYIGELSMVQYIYVSTLYVPVHVHIPMAHTPWAAEHTDADW